jgi:hypothetical protein
MATLAANDFSSYVLTEEEIIQGQILTIAQEQVIQNQLSDCAMEKIALPYDPNNTTAFAQQEAYKRGQMDALRYILDCSLAAKEMQLFKANNPEA